MDKLVTTSRERFWNPNAWRRDQWIQTLAQHLPAGSRVLDAGAGASKYRPFFAHCRYETQDFCQYQGELVKYLQPIDHVCDITRIPLPDASLDAILCTEVLEHVPEPVAVVKEFSRLLKTGGQLWLTAPHGCNVHMEPYHFFNGFTEYWYRHWLPAFGLMIESMAPQGGPGWMCVIYTWSFFESWREWERTLSAPKRVVLFAARTLCKLPIQYLLPWVAIRFDRYLSPRKVNSGLMVVARKS